MYDVPVEMGILPAFLFNGKFGLEILIEKQVMTGKPPSGIWMLGCSGLPLM
jgi:hypothetical protein